MGTGFPGCGFRRNGHMWPDGVMKSASKLGDVCCKLRYLTMSVHTGFASCELQFVPAVVAELDR